MKLNAQGRKLLKQFDRLPVRVAITAALGGTSREFGLTRLTLRS